MPQVTIQGFGRVNFPEGMSPKAIESAIESDIMPVITQRRQAMQADMERMADPLAGTRPSYRFAAGYGKAGADIARGLGQAVGLVDREEVAEARRRDEPLMRSGAGMAGNIAGNIAALAPTAAIPGAATLRGAAAIGAGVGAASPSTSTGETALNVLGGAALGAGGQAVAGRIARSLQPGAPVAGRAAEAMEAGFTIPPSQIPGAGVLPRFAEGLAGKLQTAQAASAKNQPVANRLAREALGLPEDAPLDVAALARIRKDAGQAYAEVKRVGAMAADDEYLRELSRIGEKYRGAEVDFPGLGKTPISDVIESLKRPQFSSSGAVDAISILRDKADVAFRGGDKGLGKAFREASKALEDVIERNLASIASETGPLARTAPELLQRFRAGRELIAKTYSVEKALNETTGNISLQTLANELKKGKPLTGPLRQAAEFGRAFPRAAQRTEQIGSQPGVSPLDYAAGGLMSAASGNYGLMGTVLGRPAVRAALLSRPAQRAMAAAMRPGMLSRLPGVAGREAQIEELLRRGSVPLAGSLATE